MKKSCLYFYIQAIVLETLWKKNKNTTFQCHFVVTKKCIRFENTLRRIPEFLLWQVHRQGPQKSMECPKWTFFTSWHWPLTYDLDLRTWPRYPPSPPCQNSGPYVCPFTQERETHTDTHTMSKLLHVTDVGCKNQHQLKETLQTWHIVGVRNCRHIPQTTWWIGKYLNSFVIDWEEVESWHSLRKGIGLTGKESSLITHYVMSRSPNKVGSYKK